MKHIKLFEQFDDYELEDIFGKEPELEILKLADDYYVGRVDGITVYLYKEFGYVGSSGFNRNPQINDYTPINVYEGVFKKYAYKDLPQKIKDKL